MELILLQKVRNLGTLGDKVNVKPGYGRNYLLPQGKAMRAVAQDTEASAMMGINVNRTISVTFLVLVTLFEPSSTRSSIRPATATEAPRSRAVTAMMGAAAP